jgi:two-component system, OmpR family, phosphate regulon response regulator PhoB
MESLLQRGAPLSADRPTEPRAIGGQRILIIDGDSQTTNLLRTRLTDAGFSVTVLASHEDVAAVITRDDPHLVMLDLDLPGAITMALMRHVTQRATRDRKLRLIALSAYAGEERVVDGLDQGLDDYVVKPFSVLEVMARIRALLRPLGNAQTDQRALEFNSLRLDLVDKRATVFGHRVHLRAVEFRLLEFLMRHPERAYAREQLLSQVWGQNYDVDARAVDVTVQRIRRSLEPYGWRGYLQTIRGLGYRLSAASE